MKNQKTTDPITAEQLEEIAGDVLFGGKPKNRAPTKEEANRKFKLVKRK